MKDSYEKATHLVHWNVRHYRKDGRMESDWDMSDQTPIDKILEEYIEGVDENEDRSLTRKEKERLQDFVLYMKHCR